jgi:hypothetical protein
MGTRKINRILLIAGLALTLLLAACVRSATNTDDELASIATEKSAATADAEIQQTLEALLGSATVEMAAATSTPTPVELEVVTEATATVDGAQLTELAAVLTEAATTPTAESMDDAEASATPTANATSTACFSARYVYDESYPDGTRVDAGQAMQKTWRLQNVGTCDWVSGQYELVFVTGDRMQGQTPLTMNITVLAGNYANFSINLRAPNEPGTYRGEWILRTKGGDVIGVGPNADLPIWIEIIVRG